MQQLTCTHCNNFFLRFVCSAKSHGECDCPKCQGYCTCAAQDGKLPDQQSYGEELLNGAQQ